MARIVLLGESRRATFSTCNKENLIAFAYLVWLGQVTSTLLLGFSFLVATSAGLILPAWQAVVPQLVPRQHLQPAVALSSVGRNFSRAAGPALANVIIVMWGVATPFWLNAISTFGVVAALMWWQPSGDVTGCRLPPEQFHRAIRAGLRHALYNPNLTATLIRAAGFFIFASAYWRVRAGRFGKIIGAALRETRERFLLPSVSSTSFARRILKQLRVMPLNPMC